MPSGASNTFSNVVGVGRKSSKANAVRARGSSHGREMARGTSGPKREALAALKQNREQVLMLPPVYRPRGLRDLAQLTDEDLSFLVSYYEEQAAEVVGELERRAAAAA